MLDEKDLQAIAQLMTGLESRMDQKMAQQKKEIISETMVLMEAYFDPKFQALSEQIFRLYGALSSGDYLLPAAGGIRE